MTPEPPRKCATRACDIPDDILHALSHGEIQSATLVECLTLNQATLARLGFPGLSSAALNAIDAACALGVLKRMARIGDVLLSGLGTAGIAQCSANGADTVRGWACFMIGARSGWMSHPNWRPSDLWLTTHTLACANGRGWPCARI